MLNAAKSLLTSCCVGFVRDRGAREAKNKKKGFSHLPPPPPPPLLGKIVRHLYFLASVRVNVHYLFIYAVTYIKWWG